MKKFVQEFREFILRGNVIELAVGMLMGTAFAAVVGAFSENIIQPIINAIAGNGITDGNWSVNILGAEIGLGGLITAIFNFLVTAFVAFLIVKGYNKLQHMVSKKQGDVEETPTTPTTEELLADILKTLQEKK